MLVDNDDGLPQFTNLSHDNVSDILLLPCFQKEVVGLFDNDKMFQDLPLGLPAKYWLDMRGYSPPEAARDLKQPMLILQGGRDYQVTMQDFEGWQNALSSRQDVQFKMYPRLNHLFIEGEGNSTPAEYEQAGHVAEIVVDDIARWIRQR